MRSRTQHKLDEAKFFLAKMRESHFDVAKCLSDKARPTTTPDFLYYLSAFISAARSVTWVMRSEYGEHPGWADWFDNEEQLDEERDLLSAFTKLRNTNLKNGDLVATFSPSYVPVPKAGTDSPFVYDGKKPRYFMTLENITKRGRARTISKSEVFVDTITWRTYAFGEKDLLQVCDRYYRMLALLVKKCGRVFTLAED